MKTKNTKRQEAINRQKEKNQRNPQEQYQLLNTRFGIDKGAYKERQKLRKLTSNKRGK